MRGEVEMFAMRARNRLIEGFVPQPLIVFDTYEGGKLRHIEAPTVEDAICHRAAMRILEPIAYKRMVPKSYCPVLGRGGLKMARDLQRMIKRCEETCRIHNKTHRQKWKTWILKSDIRKFFPSITHEVAMNALGRIFAEREVLTYFEASLGYRDGVPIGAGYSALVANAVLMQMDWEIISRKDVFGYVRYMDDTAVVCRSKKAAAEIHEAMENELAQIGLTTRDKWSKFPASHHAVEMGGWRVYKKGIYPSSRVERHLLKLLGGGIDRLSVKGCRALASLYGYVKNGDSMTLKNLWRRKHADRVFCKVG